MVILRDSSSCQGVWKWATQLLSSRVTQPGCKHGPLRMWRAVAGCSEEVFEFSRELQITSGTTLLWRCSLWLTPQCKKLSPSTIQFLYKWTRGSRGPRKGCWLRVGGRWKKKRSLNPYRQLTRLLLNCCVKREAFRNTPVCFLGSISLLLAGAGSVEAFSSHHVDLAFSYQSPTPKCLSCS